MMNTPSIIVENRKARFDYELEDTFEAGLKLEGWEVKSLLAGKVQLVDSYVMIKNGEAFLVGAHITPGSTTAAHTQPDSQRTRKLLLNKREINRIAVAVQQKGYTCVCTDIHRVQRFFKAKICLARGKQQHDKRQAERDRDWSREQGRALRSAGR